MFNFFDSYERNARVYPAIIISIPIIITCYSFSVLIDSSVFLKITGSSAIVLVGIVLLSSVVRFFGKKIELDIWKKWGGAASTRYLRENDTKIAKEIKQKFYKKIMAETKIDLQNNLTDEKINQAFTFARHSLRNINKNSLVVKFNYEYGFVRNLLGSRWLWVFISFIASVICYFSIRYFPGDTISLVIGTIFNGCYGLVAIICGWFILPGLTKGIAERYAEEVIFSYISNLN